MKERIRFTVTFILMLAGFFSASIYAESAKVSEDEAKALASDVYIYGYPLVTMEMTRRVMTNVEKPDSMRAPLGQFIHVRTFPTPSMTDVTTPNSDTLYSSAWLDLSKNSYILHVPDELGRYYLFQLLSGWTNVFASLGTRTTGTKENYFLIVGPEWKGRQPHRLKIYHSPTNMVWIIGRTYSTGTPDDLNKVHALQDQYTLRTLKDRWKKVYVPPNGTVSATVNMKTPVRDQVNALNASQFFNTLATSMKDNPPSAQDAAMVAKMKKLGIVPGEQFDISKVDPAIAKGLEQAVKEGPQTIVANVDKMGISKNGWKYSFKNGNFGKDYLTRAVVAYFGLGANLADDAIYPMTTVDNTGKTLNGSNHYVIHIARGQLPPVKGFWSLTLYNDKFFFAPNSLNRFNLNDRSDMTRNNDGSVDIYIQHESPGVDREANWLPAPKGNFALVFRFYWPKAAILDGKWVPPAVRIRSS